MTGRSLSFEPQFKHYLLHTGLLRNSVTPPQSLILYHDILLAIFTAWCLVPARFTWLLIYCSSSLSYIFTANSVELDLCLLYLPNLILSLIHSRHDISICIYLYTHTHIYAHTYMHINIYLPLSLYLSIFIEYVHG